MNSYKHFRNSELKSLRKNCKQAERHFFISSENIRNSKRSQFIWKQKIFQNRFGYYERQYNLNKSTNIERFRIYNPKEFWRLLKNLGLQILLRSS